MIDLAELGLPRQKRYSDKTLMIMRKKDLIKYIRTLEKNYDVAMWFNAHQAKNFEMMLKEMRGEQE